jgi:hypothetical protein
MRHWPGTTIGEIIVIFREVAAAHRPGVAAVFPGAGGKALTCAATPSLTADNETRI